MATDARERERKALEAAYAACPHHPGGLCSQLKHDCDNMCHYVPWSRRSTCAWIGHERIEAYGRAVREADKEAIDNLRLNAQKRTMMVDACWAGKLDCREVLAFALQEAAAAIKALENKQC